MPGPEDRPRPARLPWRVAAVLVCRECDGAKGFGPKKVRTALKAGAKGLPKRSVRVLSVSCLDACPRDGVTVAVTGPSTRAVVVRTPSQCEALVGELTADLRAAS